MEFPIHEFESADNGKTPVHLALANGFPPQSYAPMLTPITAERRAFTLLPRPLWPEPPPPESLTSWRVMARDLLEGWRAHGVDRVIAMGHSFGAVASLIATVRDPARVAGLILLDPTIFVTKALRAIGQARREGNESRMPLIEGARRRRSRFADEDEAFAYWRAKPLFGDWPDDVLWLYTRGITRPAPEGGIELAWSPAWEARGYEMILTTTWNDVRVLRRLEDDAPPVLIVRGTDSNTFYADAAAQMQRALPLADTREVVGGHLFPHAAAKETGAIIAGWIARRGL